MANSSSNDSFVTLGYPRISEAQIEDFLKQCTHLHTVSNEPDPTQHLSSWGETINTLPDHLTEETIDLTSPDLPQELDQNKDYCPLSMEGILGVGGEGFVQLARQKSLDRSVAVKRVLNPNTRLTQRLITEAKLTGSLEHPNIIPIHALIKTKEGEPLIIMKRVEGYSWEAQLNQQGPLWDSDQSDRLLDNIQIFLQVCRAVEFAHSKEILHLDIKPENVMLGSYGEVYLVDWGIAKRIEQLKHLNKGQISGTPHFMASEMTQDLSSVTKHSDIALLGSTLHRVLMGSTRYKGQSLSEVLMSAREAKPSQYPREVHRELAGIINMACHRDPLKRFQNVTDLRQAIEIYLEHRISIEMLAKGKSLLKELVEKEEHFSRIQLNQVEPRDLSYRQNTYRELALTCRLTFERALESWPENWPAKTGLDHLLVRWAKFELSNLELNAAENLLRKVTTPPPFLLAELSSKREQVKREEDEQLKLKEIKHALSFKSTSSYQSLAIILNGLFWSCCLMVIGSLNRQRVIHFDQQLNLEFSTYAALFVGLGLILYWQLFTDTIWRKRFTAAYMVYLLLAYLCRPLSISLDLSYQQSLCIDGLLLTMFTGQLAAFIHPYMWIATLISLGSTLGCIFFPQWNFEYLALAILSGNLCLSTILGDPAKIRLYT